MTPSRARHLVATRPLSNRAARGVMRAEEMTARALAEVSDTVHALGDWPQCAESRAEAVMELEALAEGLDEAQRVIEATAQRLRRAGEERVDPWAETATKDRENGQ